MDPLFICPPGAAITTIPSQTCPETIEQVCRALLQRKQTTGFLTTTTGILKTNWTPLLTATDSTKVQGTPLFANTVIPKGAILKEGGNDNTTINGIPKLTGRGFVAVTAILSDVMAAIRTALRAYAADSALQPGFTNLTAYLVNRFGQLICRKLAGGSNIAGIDIYNFYVGDVGTEGLGKSTDADMSFDLAPGWSDDLVILTPTDFNPMYL